MDVQELKQYLEHLKSLKRNGTQLISIYIIGEKVISETSNRLRSEYSTSSNIKDKNTRDAVLGALSKILHYLGTIGNLAPKNGLAIFASDAEIIAFEPPFKVAQSSYKCESKFNLSALEDMLAPQHSFGLMVMDGQECSLATLRGFDLKIIAQVRSMAPGKQSHGGQSSARFQRIRTESIEYYYKHIGEYMDRIFLGIGLDGIIIGGPGPAKEDFLKLKAFNYQHKILGCFNTGYTDEQGFRELMQHASDVLKEQEMVMEKAIIDKFMEGIRKDNGVAYGLENVSSLIESGRVKRLIIGDDKVKVYKSLCDKAKEKEIEIIHIGDKTQEGLQFNLSFRGLGAFKKY